MEKFKLILTLLSNIYRKTNRKQYAKVLHINSWHYRLFNCIFLLYFSNFDVILESEKSFHNEKENPNVNNSS